MQSFPNDSLETSQASDFSVAGRQLEHASQPIQQILSALNRPGRIKYQELACLTRSGVPGAGQPQLAVGDNSMPVRGIHVAGNQNLLREVFYRQLFEHCIQKDGII